MYRDVLLLPLCCFYSQHLFSMMPLLSTMLEDVYLLSSVSRSDEIRSCFYWLYIVIIQIY